jgi:hypothetical protein
MMGIIAILIVGMALFWLLFLLFFRRQLANGYGARQSKQEFDQRMGERQGRSGKRRRHRVVKRCDPEPISPPTKVERYCDRSRLEKYADGSEALYDEFGNLVYFKADPKRN